MSLPENNSVSAIVCTKNSISGIEGCLESLRQAGVGQIIVVDAHSTDGTAEIAAKLADLFLTDPGTGLGNARNIGIASSTGDFVLNMGSDNIMPMGQLEIMLQTLVEGGYSGVSAQTHIQGAGFVVNGLNAWREGRFRPGPNTIIGTPTLFPGDLIRQHPYDPTAVYSDDSDLCERWAHNFDAKFAISDAFVCEVGKVTWPEVKVRCRMYGQSDAEIFRKGQLTGWGLRRKLKSLTHPARADFFTPVRNLPVGKAVANTPFLGLFALLRYRYWFGASRKNR